LKYSFYLTREIPNLQVGFSPLPRVDIIAIVGINYQKEDFMFNRRPREHGGRRFDQDDEFKNRAGALDRRRGYGERLAHGPYEGVGPRNYRPSDERIREDVCMRLTQHGQIDASEVEVEVNEGEVTLSGTVEDRRIKRMVEANVELIGGVVDVHNRLRLRNRPGREELAKEKLAREMAEKFPGGSEPTGPAAMLEKGEESDYRPEPDQERGSS
jgi:hypothetical protein